MVWSLLILGGVLFGFLGVILGIAILCWIIRISLIVTRDVVRIIYTELLMI